MFTIGYATHTPDSFAARLVDQGVRRLIDVRELPLSRRKGFSKTALSERLKLDGIEYVHVRAVGNPHRAQKHDIARCLELYEGHLRAAPLAISQVLALVLGAPSALLCVEACAAECHRSVLARMLVGRERGLRVVDL